MTDIRILTADSEQRHIATLRKALESHGYLVVGEARDGIAAVNMVRQLRPDIAVIDAQLPHSNGIDVAQVLREENLAPVILTTSMTDRELVLRAREAGVLGYLVKPIKDDDLMPVIEVARVRWLEQCARHKELLQLRDKLETRKVIERAKGYLMDSQGLHEAEAFRKIQRLAMNSRRTMREVAQAILIAQQIQPDKRSTGP
jgi:response regulator NasT